MKRLNKLVTIIVVTLSALGLISYLFQVQQGKLNSIEISGLLYDDCQKVWGENLEEYRSAYEGCVKISNDVMTDQERTEVVSAIFAFALPFVFFGGKILFGYLFPDREGLQAYYEVFPMSYKKHITVCLSLITVATCYYLVIFSPKHQRELAQAQTIRTASAECDKRKQELLLTIVPHPEDNEANAKLRMDARERNKDILSPEAQQRCIDGVLVEWRVKTPINFRQQQPCIS